MESVSADVRLIAHTEFSPWEVSDIYDAEWSNAELLAFAGRTCYQSYNRPNPDTAHYEDYIRNVIEQKHYSVLEHASVSFYLGGVSRNLTHELVRHRHLSFSELSGRYVNPVKAELGVVTPPGLSGDLAEDLLVAGDEAEANYRWALSLLAESSIKGKRAREAVRSFLLGSVETRIVVSGNLRSWMEFVSKRDHPAADAEMRLVAGMVAELLAGTFPAVFGPEVRAIWDDEYAQSAPRAEQ